MLCRPSCRPPVRLLQDQAIAPVDMAQSAIGPGMAVFSRYTRVLEADSSRMRVRTALALINEVLEEVLSSEETEFDSDTRWALTWYEQFGHSSGALSGMLRFLLWRRTPQWLEWYRRGLLSPEQARSGLLTR